MNKCYLPFILQITANPVSGTEGYHVQLKCYIPVKIKKNINSDLVWFYGSLFHHEKQFECSDRRMRDVGILKPRLEMSAIYGGCMKSPLPTVVGDPFISK